jgi:protein pelota
MKILKKDLKKGEISFLIENLDDLWVLNQLIEPGDEVKGKTERKIKIGDDGDRNIKVIRKTVFLKLKVEKIELSETGSLRILGTITDGPEDIAHGEHHSFNLEPGTNITIIKTRWLKYQLERIKEATNQQLQNIIAVIFDREEAYFAKMKGKGWVFVAKINGDVKKKEEKHNSKNDFYKEIIEKITQYNNNDKPDHIILASPGFWKEEILKRIPEELKSKIVSATISQASESAINELVKRSELREIVNKNQSAKETNLMDELMKNISKDSACYGLENTKEKINNGAVKDLFISLKYLQKSKQKEFYHKIEQLMVLCESMDGKIHIISSENAEKVLDSISGIAGILRWKS